MTERDESLDVERARRGDREAFARLVARYARRVHDLARRMLRDPAEAEDVAQQAFWNAWRALERFDPSRPFQNWLLRIASNLCRNRLAARGRARVLRARGGEDDLPEPAARGSGGEDGGGRGPGPAPEDRARLGAAIEALPEHLRLAIVLYYVHGLDLASIGQVADLPVATVKTHLHRGRAALRRTLLPPETPPARGGTTPGRTS